MSQRYIVSHTSIRGIAALLVVFYHMQFGTDVFFPWESATPFFAKGYLWVDLFFILSGFVISYSTRSEDRAPFDWRQIQDFWVHRFARIYPLHLFCLGLLVAVMAGETLFDLLRGKPMPAGGPWSGQSLFALAEQALLLNGWGLSGSITWNIPSWSISAEAVAYLLFPMLAALVAFGRHAALALLTAGAIAFYGWVAATSGSLDIVQGLAILRCLSGFSLGILLYHLRGPIERLPDRWLTTLQIASLVPIFATLLLGLNDVIAIPGFVLLVATTWPDRGLLATRLKADLLHWLGEISYSVYLNHFWVLRAWHFVAVRVFKQINLDPLLARGIEMAVGVILVLVISHLTYRLVEGPARTAIVT